MELGPTECQRTSSNFPHGQRFHLFQPLLREVLACFIQFATGNGAGMMFSQPICSLLQFLENAFRLTPTSGESDVGLVWSLHPRIMTTSYVRTRRQIFQPSKRNPLWPTFSRAISICDMLYLRDFLGTET